MIILVTGSAGMLGAELCKLLAEGGYFFTGLDLKEPSQQALPPEAYIQADILNRQVVASILLDIKPDIVIHAAAYTAVDDCEANEKTAFAVNETGSLNVAEAAAAAKADFIYISTDYVFDGKKTTPYEVTDMVNPLSVYGKSKLAGEEKVKEIFSQKHIIVRTSWLYGSSGPNFVDKIIAAGRQQETLKVVNDQTGSPTYAFDLAEALIKICGCLKADPRNSELYGIYHITNKNVCNWCDYAREILKYANLNAAVEPISSAELRLIYTKNNKKYAPRPDYSALSNRRYNNLTLRALRPWQDALKGYLGQN